MPILEHANLTVADLDASVAFIRTAFPSFAVRGQGAKDSGRAWLHLGTDSTYVALEQAGPERLARAPYAPIPGFNHLGWVVEDLAALCQRMAAAGYPCNLESDSHPARRRCYFHDPDGNDWEFIEYLTDEVSQRNDYSS